MYLQILSGVVLITGFIETIVGALANSVVSSNGFGSWWAGVLCVVAGVCGIMQGTPQMRSTGYCLSIIAVIAALIGLIIDGIGLGIVHVLDTCINQNGVIYGNTETQYQAAAIACLATDDNYNCNCININQDDTCYLFNLGHDTQNCQQILGYFTVMLRKSVNTLWALFWFCTIYSIWYCSVMQCGPSCENSCPLPGCCTVDSEAASAEHPSVQQSTQQGVARPLEPGEQIVYVNGVPTIVRNQQQPQVVYVINPSHDQAGQQAGATAMAYPASAGGDPALNKA